MSVRITLLALVLLVCASAGAQVPIHRFTSNAAWNVNSWVLESDSGLVLIDGQMLRGDATRLAGFLAGFEKPLAAVVITHPHPDHFLGLSVLRDRFGKFPIYATEQTAAGLLAARDMYMSWAPASYGDEVISELVDIDNTFTGELTIEAAGFTLNAYDFGMGEGAGHAVVYHSESKSLFTGDVVMAHSHHYVGEGRSALMIKQLQRLRSDFPHTNLIYAGHGDPVRLTMVDDHIAYITFVREQAAKLLSDPTNVVDDALTPEAQQAFAANVIARYPSLTDYGLPTTMLMGMNLGGLVKELAAEKP